MYKNFIKSALLAATLALGGVAAGTQTASAGSASVYVDLPGFSIGYSEAGNRRYRGQRYGHRNRGWDRGYGHRRVCNPRRAIRKARRNGIRRAHIVRAGRRGIVVAGRQWGERVVIGFGRGPRCPVRFVRSR